MVPIVKRLRDSHKTLTSTYPGYPHSLIYGLWNKHASNSSLINECCLPLTVFYAQVCRLFLKAWLSNTTQSQNLIQSNYFLPYIL